jgi:hypothetical protein
MFLLDYVLRLIRHGARVACASDRLGWLRHSADGCVRRLLAARALAARLPDGAAAPACARHARCCVLTQLCRRRMPLASL